MGLPDIHLSDSPIHTNYFKSTIPFFKINYFTATFTTWSPARTR